MKLLATALVLATAVPAAAQPGTDLFRMRLHEQDGRITIDSVRRITERAGYDNQPHVLPGGGAVLYTSIDDAGQADIFRYDVRTQRSERVTRTAPESEYSATVMPSGDRFSAIRVEADSIQRLWSFRLDGSDGRPVLERIAPVGYHAWIDEERVAIFVLGDPPTLQIANVRTGEAGIVAEDIGRALHRVPGRAAISFLQRDGTGRGTISSHDVATGETSALIDAFAENEYHAWTPAGTLLTARGSALYAWRPGTSNGWSVVADLSEYGVHDISRLAVSDDGRWLVIVAADG